MFEAPDTPPDISELNDTLQKATKQLATRLKPWEGAIQYIVYSHQPHVVRLSGAQHSLVALVQSSAKISFSRFAVENVLENRWRIWASFLR